MPIFPAHTKTWRSEIGQNHTKESTEGSKKAPTYICMAPLYSISTTEPRGPNPSIICTHTHRTVRSLEALAGYQIRASQSSLPQCSSEAAPYPNHPHANEHTSLSLQVKTRTNKHCRKKKKKQQLLYRIQRKVQTLCNR